MSPLRSFSACLLCVKRGDIGRPFGRPPNTSPLHRYLHLRRLWAIQEYQWNAYSDGLGTARSIEDDNATCLGHVRQGADDAGLIVICRWPIMHDVDRFAIIACALRAASASGASA